MEKFKKMKSKKAKASKPSLTSNEKKVEEKQETSADVFNDEVLNNLMANLNIQELIASNKTSIDEVKTNFLSNLYKMDRERLEELTRGQNTNNLWKEQRKVRLTASNFGRVVQLSPGTSTKTLIKTLLYGTFSGNMHTFYGQANEANAKVAFEKAYKKKVISCGLVADKCLPFLAASPDGFVENESAIVEFKCPSVARDLSPLEGAKQGKISYCYLKDNKLRLRKTHAYMYQVQGQMHIADVEKCYFVVWTRLGMSVQEIHRDEQFWVDIEPRLVEFYMEALLPEIIKMKINDCSQGEIKDYYLKC